MKKCLIFVGILLCFLLSFGCATTDHDRTDAYYKGISEMQASVSNVQKQRLLNQQLYAMEVANEPFIVIKFDKSGKNLKEVRINNSILLNQMAMAGGDAAYQQFAMADTLRNVKGPTPYWYETLASGVGRNIGGIVSMAGMTYLGVHALDEIADVSAAGIAAASPSVTNSINSHNTTSEGSTSVSNHIDTSTGIETGVGIGSGQGNRNGAVTEPVTSTGTGTGTDTGVEYDPTDSLADDMASE